MHEKMKSRPSSAGRQRRVSANSTTQIYFPPPALDTATHISGVDYRSYQEKIEDLQNKCEKLENDSTFEEYLEYLVLLQLYTSLEYGEYSMENARTCLNLCKFYLNRQKLLLQAHSHIVHARTILLQVFDLKKDLHLSDYFLALEIYQYSVKCSLQARDPSAQRKLKKKLIISSNEIDDDFRLMEKQLDHIQDLTTTKVYDEKRFDYLMLKFEYFIENRKEFNSKVPPLVEQMIEYIDKYQLIDSIPRKVDVHLRYASYLGHFDSSIRDTFEIYQKAVVLAEDDENKVPSNENKHRLGDVLFQWARTRVRAERLTDSTERKFKRALELYRTDEDRLDINAMKIVDELAMFYARLERYQDALTLLNESVADRQRFYGECSDEVIQIKSRIAAIYLRECKYLHAAEHFKECLELQEFVYGPKDFRTRQTRDALEILKKDPQVSQTFFDESSQKDRPAFRHSKTIPHEKEDHQLLFTTSGKPPNGSKH